MVGCSGFDDSSYCVWWMCATVFRCGMGWAVKAQVVTRAICVWTWVTVTSVGVMRARQGCIIICAL